MFEVLTATASAKVENGVTSPSVLYKTEPACSKEALKGKLDGEAVEAVEKWRWRPGLKDGKAVTVAATIQVNFRTY